MHKFLMLVSTLALNFASTNKLLHKVSNKICTFLKKNHKGWFPVTLVTNDFWLIDGLPCGLPLIMFSLKEQWTRLDRSFDLILRLIVNSIDRCICNCQCLTETLQLVLHQHWGETQSNIQMLPLACYSIFHLHKHSCMRAHRHTHICKAVYVLALVMSRYIWSF